MQLWAILKVQEFEYRKLFHLSKREMMEEPIEDVINNLTILSLKDRKTASDQNRMEQKAQRGL